MKIKPLHDRVIVRRMPAGATEQPMQGDVVAVGNGKQLENGDTFQPSVKVGDKVLFDKFAGTEITVNGEVVVVMREAEIMATLCEAVSEKQYVDPNHQNATDVNNPLGSTDKPRRSYDPELIND